MLISPDNLMTRERQRPHNLTTTLFIYCLYIRTLIVVA